MIPKTMNFFWLGRMSWIRWLTLWSFRRLNPDWPIALWTVDNECFRGQWTSGEIDDSFYSGVDYRNRTAELNVTTRTWRCPLNELGTAQTSDIFRWWMLREEGGWYADMDILWLRPFTPIHNSIAGSDAVFCLEVGYMAIGLLAGSKECSLFRGLYELASGVDNRNDYQGYGAHLIYSHAGMLPTSYKNSAPPGSAAMKLLVAKYPSLNIALLPENLVYPYDWRKFPQFFKRRCPVPSTIGVHWFGGNKITKPFIRTVGPDNWRGFNNTFTACLERLNYKDPLHYA